MLEAALHEKGAKPVDGIGPRRLAILHPALGNMLARIRAMRTGPADDRQWISCLMSIANIA